MDLFEQEYTEISKLYCHYVNADEYSEHQLVKAIDKQSSIAVDEIMTAVNEGNADKIVVEDSLFHLAIEYEQVGFILGFTYALNLIKESGVLKEFAQ